MLREVILNPDSVAFIVPETGDIELVSGLRYRADPPSLFVLGSMLKRSRDKRESVPISLNVRRRKPGPRPSKGDPEYPDLEDEDET